MQSPPSLTPTPTGQKLRASCNQCAASKVKCSKEKPSCARCARQGKGCKYFETKRAGRKPGTQMRNVTSTPPQAVSLSESESIQHPAVSPSTTEYADLLAMTFSSASPSISTHPSLLPDAFNFPLNDFPASSHQLPMLDLPDNGDFSSLLETSHTLLPVETMPLAVQSTENADPRLNCNFSRAVGLLKGLPYSRKPGSAFTQTQTEPMADLVMKSNEEAVKAINEILECDCADDGYLLATLSIILLKVLTTYATLVQQTANPDAESPCWAPTSMTSPNQSDGEVQRTHDFGADSEDQARLVGQRILSQLHHVQRLVNTLSRHIHTVGRFEGKSLTPPPADSNTDLFASIESPFPFSDYMLSKMEANLRGRLRELLADIMDLLR
ncbi:hypothetical protein BDV10DRAFT_173471 [Aspergillus recurvatus]